MNADSLADLPRSRRALRALALQLVADPHAADDIVQDAWLAQVAEGAAVRSPRGWLASVVRNLASRWRRDTARRRRRELAAAAREGEPDGATLASRVELQRDLADAVLGLPEPYRSTLLQRFWEDRSPSQIARQTGVPVATVKSRLQRGLALVRARLQAQRGATWSAALWLGLQPGGALAAAGGGWLAVAAMLLVSLAGLWWLTDRDRAAATLPAELPSGATASATAPAAPAEPVSAARQALPQEFDGLIARVVRADGTPAVDVGVGVRGLYYERTTTKWWESYRSIGRTDASGELRATRDMLHGHLADAAWWADLPDGVAQVYIDEPGMLDSVSEPMTRAEFERARCELRMPPAGRIVLIASDALGRPLPRGPYDCVQIAEDDAGRDASRTRPVRQASWSRSYRSGRAEFASAGLGRNFHATDRAAGSTPFRGPSHAGEECVVSAGPRPGRAVIAGRLRGPQGEGLTVANFSSDLRSGLSRYNDVGLTHIDGSFAITVGDQELVGQQVDWLQLSANGLVADVSLPGRMQARNYELGTITLHPPAHVVSGRVIGLPPESRVRVQVERLEHERYLDGTELDIWRRAERVGCEIEGDRFTCRGFVPDGRLRVVGGGGHGEFLPAVVEFARGEGDLLVQFVRGASLRTRLAPATQPAAQQGLRIWLEPHAGVVPGGDRTQLTPQSGLPDLAWQGLWPGRYRLLLRAVDDLEPLHVVDPVHVGPDTTTLPPIALPRPLRRVMLRVLDTEGQPLPRYVVVSELGREHARTQFAPEGELALWTGQPQLDVFVVAAGHRAARVQLRGDTTVTLGTATQRTLALAGGLPPLPDGVELRFEFACLDGPGRLSHGYDFMRAAGAALGDRNIDPDKTGEAVVDIALPGRYRVVPALHTTKTKFGYRVPIAGAEREFTCLEADFAAPARIGLALPPDGLRAALDSVRSLLDR